jgi:hypothetical protein
VAERGCNAPSSRRHYGGISPAVGLTDSSMLLVQLDAGLPEKMMLLSRDEMSMLVVSYREVKRCLDRVYNDLCARAAAEARRSDADNPILQGSRR